MDKKVLEPFGEVIQQQHHLQQQHPVVVLQQLQLQLPQQPHPQVQGPPHQGPRVVQINYGFNPPQVGYGQPRYVRGYRPPMNQHGPQWHQSPQVVGQPHPTMHPHPVMVQQGQKRHIDLPRTNIVGKIPVFMEGKTIWVDKNKVILNMEPNNTNPNKTNSVINNHNDRPPGGHPKRLKTDKQESNVQSGNHFSDVGFESVQKYIDSLEEENKSLKKDLEKLNDSKLCQVCMESDACIVFIPCGHLMSCVNCSIELKECAVCRKPITSTVRTYFS